MATRYGGYEYKFAEKDLERYTCSTICTKVLKDPHITGCCGQHFCESCLNYWLTERRKQSCPHCRAEGGNFQHFLDKKLKREIDCLRIHCTNKEEGCQWIGELESLKTHLESANGCVYIRVNCPNGCLVKIRRKRLSNHVKNDCSLRLYQCEHCGFVDTYESITGGYFENYQVTTYGCHYNTCPEFPQVCSMCGGKRKRKKMDAHVRRCREEEVECPYKCMSPRAEQRQPIYPIESQSLIDGNLAYFESFLSQVQLPNNYETTKVKRKNLDKHRSECVLRPYKCEHCGKQDTYTVIIVHYDECREIRIECPNRCGAKFIKRKDMKRHRSQCPEEWVECPFKDVGCKQTFLRRKLQEHLSVNQQEHRQMIKELKRDNSRLKENKRRVKLENHTLQDQNTRLEQDVLRVERKNAELEVANFLLRQAQKENERVLKIVNTIRTAAPKAWKMIKVAVLVVCVIVVNGILFLSQ